MVVIYLLETSLQWGRRRLRRLVSLVSPTASQHGKQRNSHGKSNCGSYVANHGNSQKNVDYCPWTIDHIDRILQG